MCRKRSATAPCKHLPVLVAATANVARCAWLQPTAACNIIGDADVVARKVAVLHAPATQPGAIERPSR